MEQFFIKSHHTRIEKHSVKLARDWYNTSLLKYFFEELAVNF